MATAAVLLTVWLLVLTAASFQIRAGGLQRAVLAGPGRQHARPPVVPAAARAGADAAVPYRGGAGLGPGYL